MSDETAAKINKLIPIAKKIKGRAYVKGTDLQIHVPTIKEAQQLEQSPSFKNVLGKYVDGVNALQHDADTQVQRLVAGETEDLHEVMIAMDEAETSFELMMEIRNKLVDAYRELSKMQ